MHVAKLRGGGHVQSGKIVQECGFEKRCCKNSTLVLYIDVSDISAEMLHIRQALGTVTTLPRGASGARDVMFSRSLYYKITALWLNSEQTLIPRGWKQKHPAMQTLCKA